MFEITYNDTDALERYEEEKRAYPGAKYDFTLASMQVAFFHISHCKIRKNML